MPVDRITFPQSDYLKLLIGLLAVAVSFGVYYSWQITQYSSLSFFSSCNSNGKPMERLLHGFYFHCIYKVKPDHNNLKIDCVKFVKFVSTSRFIIV